MLTNLYKTFICGFSPTRDFHIIHYWFVFTLPPETPRNQLLFHSVQCGKGSKCRLYTEIIMMRGFGFPMEIQNKSPAWNK